MLTEHHPAWIIPNARLLKAQPKKRNPQLYLKVPTALLLAFGSTTQTATELGTLEFVKVPETDLGFTKPKPTLSIRTKKVLFVFVEKPLGVTIPLAFVNLGGTSKNAIPRVFCELTPVLLVVLIKAKKLASVFPLVFEGYAEYSA